MRRPVPARVGQETTGGSRTEKTLVIGFAFLILLAGALLYGAYCWNAGTQERWNRLEAARLPVRSPHRDGP